MFDAKFHANAMKRPQEALQEVLKQKAGLTEKLNSYQSRLADLTVEVAEIDEQKIAALRSVIGGTGNEKSVSALIGKSAEVDLKIKTSKEIIAGVEAALNEVEEEIKSFKAELAKAARAAWKALSDEEIDKIRPEMSRVFSVFSEFCKSNGYAGGIAQFTHQLQGNGPAIKADVATANERFKSVFGVEPMPKLYKFI